MYAKVGILAAALTCALVLAGTADSASKKKRNRSDFTAAQQKAYFDDALKRCRKAHGAALARVVVDYRRWQYVCWVR